MAVLALGVAGALLAPVGYAALGFSIGSALGGYLFAPDLPTVEGPRLGDLKVQNSAYGQMLPIVYGTARLAGNMIWSRPILETKHSEEVSGGKGGGSSQEVINYTYSQTFAVALCEGEITGIRRIWANGELIYNFGDDTSISTLYASSQVVEGIAVYTGSTSQMPDATIQAFEGVETTPAYRGTAYVVFNDLQLADYGNRTPNLEFEVVVAGSSLGPHTGTPYATPLNIVGGYVRDGVVHVHSGSFNIGDIRKYTHYIYSLDGVLLSDNSYFYSSLVSYTVSQDDPDLSMNGIGPTLTVYQRAVPIGMYNLTYAIRLFGTASDFIIQKSNGVTTEFIHIINGIEFAQLNLPAVTYQEDVFMAADGRIYILLDPILTANDNGFNVLQTWDLTSVSRPTDIRNISVVGDVLMLSGWTGAGDRIAANRFNADGTITNLGVVTITTDGMMSLQISPYIAITNLYPVIFDPKVISDGTYGLGAMVTDICTRVGLTAGDLDVAAMTDLVDGYVISRRMTARAAIEPLINAFFFDAVESSGKIKFVKRGGSVAAAIAEDDLACQVDGGSNSADPIRITRAQEMDLPTEVTVSYLDSGAAYQTGTQSSRRLITSSKKVLDLQFAIAMTATKAKQIADVALYASWMARNRAPLVTDRRFAYLEPTDIITATQGDLTWTLRIEGKTERDGLIEWQCTADDVASYTQTNPAIELPLPPLTVDLAGPTQLQLLDIPLLRDLDDGYGFYAAAAGYLTGWSGAQLYKSSDGGASWQLTGSGFLRAAKMGTANTVLGNFSGGNVFDELNTVTVVMNGSLSSITDLAVLNGGNAILIGNEVLQFKNATLTAANTYQLTGLLRGRRGTEWAMSGHAAGERVVLLTTSTIYRLPDASAELNLIRDWRAVSFGSYLDQAENIRFADTGIGLECYSPVQIGGGRNASGDLTINWRRRTRIGGEWRDYVDSGLGEASENYEVDVMNGGAVVRVISGLTSPTASYTAANQTTDFGSPQASVSVRVYQLSAAVGRGYPGTATI